MFTNSSFFKKEVIKVAMISINFGENRSEFLDHWYFSCKFGLLCSVFLMSNRSYTKTEPSYWQGFVSDILSLLKEYLNVDYYLYEEEDLAYGSSAWNKYFVSAGHHVRQLALRAGHSQFVPVFCIWYTIEIWKPAGLCDRQKTNHVGHTWNCAGQWPRSAVISCTYVSKTS